MNRLSFYLSILILAVTALAGSVHSGEPTQNKYNRLIHEKSPYLLQHAENPINWYPWGNEALKAASDQNKPVFLSIGYSTCYWCHFMEKDSFEKTDVAKILNQHFIAIKVDREERPDVDNIYMSALVSMRGSGGWPISMFLLPNGKPFFGRSTIRHNQFVTLLNKIAQTWASSPGKFETDGNETASRLDRILQPKSKAIEAQNSVLIKYLDTCARAFDVEYGGFGKGNKFPRPHLYGALMRIHRRMNETRALEIVTKSLKSMAHGGLHDVLVGGFHRYCVDRKWEVPHFEKMLYDNAGLASVFLEAYQVTGDKEFADIVRQTLDWVLMEMTHENGGFYSAQDAGEVDEEGDYYGWGYHEVKHLLSLEEFNHIKKLFRLTEHGNFEYRNIIHIPDDVAFPSHRRDPLYAAARDKLIAARSDRKRPRLDDKILTSWNGFMIAALAKAYQTLGDDKYLRAAQRAAGFIRKNLTTPEGLLYRRWRDGESSEHAIINDYAYLINGLLELYQADFDTEWFNWAITLQANQDKDFWDNENGGYFFDDGRDKTLISRSKKYEDSAIPSGNSISALNLLRLADFTYDDQYRQRARRLIRSCAARVSRNPFGYPQMLTAIDYALDRSKEIAIIGVATDVESNKLLNTVRKAFIPNKVIAYSDKTGTNQIKLLTGKTAMNGQSTAYVCEQGVCKLPTTEVRTLLDQANAFEPLERE